MTAIVAAVLAASLLAGDEIARVDGTPIGRAAFAERASAFRARGMRFGADDVLNSLLDEAVLADDARRAGLPSDPAVAERLAGTRRRVITDAFVQSLSASAKPTDEELRAAFHATSDFVRAQTLAYASDAEARGGADRLRSGAAVADEAKRAKSAQAAAREADAQFTMRAQLDPVLAAVLFGARPGAIVGPTKIGDAWMVAKVLEVVVGSEATFAASRPALLARARSRAGETARQHLVAQLIARTPLVIDEKFLAAAGTGPPQDAELRHVVATVGDEPIRYSEVAAVTRRLAASGNAHASTPEARRQVVRALAEERVLLAAALERGIASAPDVKLQVGLAERGVLASEALDRILRSAGDDRRQEIATSRVRELRTKAKISIDRIALAQAASALQ